MRQSAIAVAPSLRSVATIKPLPLALVVVLAFAAGFGVGWIAKPAPADYKPIAESLAAENASLREELRLKDEMIGAMAGQIDALKALAGDGLPL